VQFSGASREQFVIEENLNSRGFRTIYSPGCLHKYRRQNHYPRNDEPCATRVYLSQQVLIGSKRDVDDIVEGFAKVLKNAAML
jgi:hypothetical protein